MNGDVEFAEAVTVGTIVLQPAHYRFKHTMQSGQRYPLVSRQFRTLSLRSHVKNRRLEWHAGCAGY